MHPIYDLLSHLRSANLGHEAVIEIMLAILGVMLAVLTLISGLLAIGIAIVGWFGYTTIRDEARLRADRVARDVAKHVATNIAKAQIKRLIKQDEASGLSAAQADFKKREAASGAKVPRRKAVSDSNLRKEESI